MNERPSAASSAQSDDPPFCLGRLFFHQPTATKDRHACVIASDPVRDEKRIVVVKLSTKPGPDNPPCIVEAKEHPSIGQRSYVRCEEAGVGTLSALKQGLEVQFVSLSQVVSAGLLKKVQTALGTSRYARREVKAVLRDQGFI